MMRRAAAALASLAVCASAAADPAAWRVTGPGGGEVALLGSMHVLRASDHPLPASVDELIDRAESIEMELDLDDIDAAVQQRVVLGTATLTQGTTLADVLDADLHALLEQRTRELGVDLALLEPFEPWFLSVTLLELGLRRFGFEGERGLEQYVLGRAARNGTEIAGLETLEFQIGIFDSMTPSTQQMMLEQTLAELDEAETAMAEMASAWRAGKLDALSAELLDDFDAFPGLYATLVTERNARWLGQIEQLLRDGKRHLVVVGALHLVGRDNLIEMLAARGHRVERIH